MTNRKRYAFTLVEVTAVLVILAVLAGVAIPFYFDRARDAQISAARYAQGSLSTAIVQTRLHEDVETGGNGSWPANLDDVLFTQEGNKLLNPFREDGQPVYHIFSGNNRWHPTQKTIEWAVGANRGAIWYNPANGSVKFRVPAQPTTAATIALYNAVNQCRVTTLNQQDQLNR